MKPFVGAPKGEGPGTRCNAAYTTRDQKHFTVGLADLNPVNRFIFW